MIENERIALLIAVGCIKRLLHEIEHSIPGPHAVSMARQDLQRIDELSVAKGKSDDVVISYDALKLWLGLA